MSNDVYAFLKRPALQAGAVPDTSPLHTDLADEKLKSAANWPLGISNSSGLSMIRFSYKQTNDLAAKSEFSNIQLLFRTQLLNSKGDLSGKYPYLEDYLIRYPLGVIPFSPADPRIYKNATKLIAAERTYASVAASTEEEDTPADLGSPEATTSSQRKKKKKKKQKAKKASAPTATAEEATAPSTGEGDSAAATVDSQPEATQTPAPVPRVMTEFAYSLQELQLQFYLILRTNITRFMDKTCRDVLEADIHSHEKQNGLKDLDRLEVGKRYSWAQLKEFVYKHCCLPATPGFHFLPLYTNIRPKGQIVSKWCSHINNIHTNLKDLDETWGTGSVRDAVKRLRSLLPLQKGDGNHRGRAQGQPH